MKRLFITLLFTASPALAQVPDATPMIPEPNGYEAIVLVCSAVTVPLHKACNKSTAAQQIQAGHALTIQECYGKARAWMAADQARAGTATEYDVPMCEVSPAP